MLIKGLSEVATAKERRDISNVTWRKVSYRGERGFSQKARITALWQLGCSLTTRHCLLPGEHIWIQAKDDLGQLVFSLVGTVTWAENAFRLDGYRCEVRFRERA